MHLPTICTILAFGYSTHTRTHGSGLLRTRHWRGLRLPRTRTFTLLRLLPRCTRLHTRAFAVLSGSSSSHAHVFAFTRDLRSLRAYVSLHVGFDFSGFCIFAFTFALPFVYARGAFVYVLRVARCRIFTVVRLRYVYVVTFDLSRSRSLVANFDLRFTRV